MLKALIDYKGYGVRDEVRLTGWKKYFEDNQTWPEPAAATTTGQAIAEALQEGDQRLSFLEAVGVSIPCI